MKQFFKFILFPITGLILSLLFTIGFCKTTGDVDGCGDIIILLGPFFLLAGLILGIIYLVVSAYKGNQTEILEEKTPIWKSFFGVIVGILFATISYFLIKSLFSYNLLEDFLTIRLVDTVFMFLSPLIIFIPCFGFYLGFKLVTKKNNRNPFEG